MDASRTDEPRAFGGGVAHDEAGGEHRFGDGLVRLSTDAVISTDAAHRITSFNRGAERIFGYEAADVVGRPVSMLMPERYREGHAEHLRRFAEAPEATRMMGDRDSVYGLRENGEEFPAEASISKAEAEGELVFTVVLRDATEWTRAEDAAREAEARWRRMADALPIFFSFVDAEERYVFSNRAYLDWVAAEREKIIGRSVEEVLGERIYARVRPHIRAVLGGSRQRFTVELDDMDGRSRTMDVIYEPETTDHGRVAGFFVAALDITDRVRVEEQLERKSEAIRSLHRIGAHPSLTLDEKIQSLLALGCSQLDLGLGVFARVADGRWVVLNVHPPSSAIEPGDGFPLDGTLCARAVESSGPVGYDARTDAGPEFYPAYAGEPLGAYLGIPVRVGGEDYGVLSFTSLEPRGEAFEAAHRDLIHLMALWLGGELERERALRGQVFLAEVGRVLAASLDRADVLDSLVELALPKLADGCAVYALRSDGPVRRVRASHVDPELQAATSALPEGTLEKDGRPHPVLAALRTGESAIESWAAGEQARPCLADDTWEGLPPGACASVLVVPFKARGDVIGAIALVSEEPNRYDEHEVMIAREFASRCATALDNVSLLENARSAIAARDEVLSMVSHDLGSPLSSISMSVDRLLAIAGEDVGEDDVRSYLEGMKEAAARMEQLIEDLLEVDALERGAVRETKADFQVSGLLEAAVREMRPRFEAGSLDLEIVATTGTSVRGDRHRMMRALVNLLDNAAKFTRPGGRVEVGAERSGEGQVHVYVSDTGKGISPERLERIFDRYAQAREERRAGAGLGLAIVKKTVESYGGRVWVESELGVGSTFHFTLPES